MPRRITSRKKQTSRITVPERCHPLAKLVFAQMAKQGVTYANLQKSSGVDFNTIRSWRREKNPGLETGAAALGALGWALVPVPLLDRLPSALAEGLSALQEEHDWDTPLLNYLIVRACGVPIPIETGLQFCIRHAGTMVVEAK